MERALQELGQGQESGFPEETGRTSNGQSLLDRDLRSTGGVAGEIGPAVEMAQKIRTLARNSKLGEDGAAT